MTLRSPLLLTALATLASPSTISAQTPSALVKLGDPVPGIGNVSGIESVQLLDSGRWYTLIDTDHPDAAQDVLVLGAAGPVLREGEPLTAPFPLIFDEFKMTQVSASGNLAACARLRGVGPLDGLSWNRVPIALQNGLLVDPLVGAGTSWVNFDTCRLNRANELFVLGEVSNPDVPGALEGILCKFKLDPLGNVLASEVLLTKGQLLPGLGTTVLDLPNYEHALTINERGDWMTEVSLLGGSDVVLINGTTVVAQARAPSPVAGRNWLLFSNLGCQSLNNAGEYAFRGLLEGSGGSYLIVKNGAKFAQSGDLYPSFSSAPLTLGTLAPLVLTDGGDLFWRADSTLATDDAFLRNFTPILQANRTLFNGDLVIHVEQTDNAFSVSPNGRYFAGRVDLQLGGEAVLLVDFGLTLPLPGCSGNPGSLAVASGLALPGNALEFALDRGQAPGAVPLLTFSSRALTTSAGCGRDFAFGELLISPAHRLGSLALPTWNGSTPSTLVVPIPPDPALVDQVFFAQGVFQTPTSPRFTLTNGMRIEIGAP